MDKHKFIGCGTGCQVGAAVRYAAKLEAKVERLEAENKRIKDGWDSVDTANKKINARLRDTLAKVERLEKLEAAVKDAHGWIKRDERRYQITIAVDLWNALEAALEGELDGR